MTKMSIVALTLLSTAASYSLHARQPQEAGFSGDLGVNLFFSSNNSQFETENSTPLSQLNATNSKHSDTKVVPIGNLTYTFADKRNQLFFGASRADVAIGRLHFDIGYRHWLEDGTRLSLSFIPGIMDNEMWLDPYVTGSQRQITDSQSSAVRLEARQLFGTGLSTEIAAGQIEMDQESSGQTQFGQEVSQLLDRNADVLFAEIGYSFAINRGLILRTAANYVNYDADGAAVAYDQLGVEMTLVVATRTQSIITTLSYGDFTYDTVHPLFDQTRDEDQWSVFVAYEYRNLLGWDNWSLVSLLGYTDKSANIAFFEEESWLTSVGINYRF
uniref:DUF2860 family protein n=1 Tax=Thaumasiovibrio occultus TaxID=1891184 RepID=UPI00131B06D9|nr:DUF2860 family protein [Thaumasiovibrio occultus]